MQVQGGFGSRTAEVGKAAEQGSAAPPPDHRRLPTICRHKGSGLHRAPGMCNRTDHKPRTRSSARKEGGSSAHVATKPGALSVKAPRGPPSSPPVPTQAPGCPGQSTQAQKERASFMQVGLRIRAVKSERSRAHRGLREAKVARRGRDSGRLSSLKTDVRH